MKMINGLKRLSGLLLQNDSSDQILLLSLLLWFLKLPKEENCFQAELTSAVSGDAEGKIGKGAKFWFSLTKV